MEQMAQCSSAAINYLAEKLDLQTDYRQLLSFVPLGKIDPGLVYLCWLKSCGGKICDWAIKHAISLNYEPLSASQSREHRQRIQHLNRLEQRRKSFAHYLITESRDDACSAVVSAALASNDSPKQDFGTIISECSCVAVLSKPAADSKVGDGIQKRRDEDEWMLVFSMEPPPEVTEEALAEAEIFTGGMGLAM